MDNPLPNIIALILDELIIFIFFRYSINSKSRMLVLTAEMCRH